jgi:tetratricopeptide (TPR) repeat protein
MDIWAWVFEVQESLRETGRGRLADLIDLAPHYTTQNMHAQLDGVMPEAIALAREAKNPWIEIFVRHWQLQSCILHRHLVKKYLPEAVSLIDRASRDDAKDCPQSVCATQDLASCYGYVDGPGYAKERIAVAGETLARIDASWPCFTCISGEYASALLDDGQQEEVVAFVERQREELVRSGRAQKKDEICEALIEALIRLGRLEDALQHASRAAESRSDESFSHARSLDKARILARLGRHDESKRWLLPFDSILGTHSLYEHWADAVFHLAMSGAVPNDWQLHAKLGRLAEELEENGVYRLAIRVATMQAKLAIARKRPQSAKKSARLIERVIPELRLDLGARAELEALEREITALGSEPAAEPATPEEALGAADGDPEEMLDRLELASRKWPDHEGIALARAEAAFALGEGKDAMRILRELVAVRPTPEAVLRLVHLLRGFGAEGELDRFTEEMRSKTSDPELINLCLWSIALREYEAQRPNEAKARLEEILAATPGAVNTRTLLARIERELGNHREALAHLDRIVEQRQEPGQYDWERMLAATILGEWSIVRDSARRVGFQLEGEGPIDHDGELVRIRFPDENGATDVFGVRTGPVTARIVEVSPPAHPQRFRDLVAFDARPLNDPPAEGEEENHTFIYPFAHTLSRAWYKAHTFIGVHPGDELLERLGSAIEEAGGTLEVRSVEGYQVTVEGEDHDGVYGFVVAPPELSPDKITEVFETVTGGLEHPLSCLVNS